MLCFGKFPHPRVLVSSNHVLRRLHNCAPKCWECYNNVNLFLAPVEKTWTQVMLKLRMKSFLHQRYFTIFYSPLVISYCTVFHAISRLPLLTSFKIKNLNEVRHCNIFFFFFITENHHDGEQHDVKIHVRIS